MLAKSPPSAATSGLTASTVSAIACRPRPVSPWVFCLFSQLVAELSKGRYEEVRRVFAEMMMAESLPPLPVSWR